MSTWGNSVGHVEPTLLGYFPGSPCPTGGIHVCPVILTGSGFKVINASGPPIPPETPTWFCGCGS